MQLPDDITKNRHKNNPHSAAANEIVQPTKSAWRKKILDWAHGVKDFTLKDLCRAFNKLPNEISGRLSEMRAIGLIEETGETRERCAVLKVKPQIEPFNQQTLF